MSEITFILEPNCGRVTVETSNADKTLTDEIIHLLGNGTPLNCARPILKTEDSNFASDNEPQNPFLNISAAESIYLFRIYHESTVDGPGKRSVIQFAGCSIRCDGCYVPETHERANGRLTSIALILKETEKRSGEHDGVTIMGGEPFDQADGLEKLVISLKQRNYHLTVYTGYTLESLLERGNPTIKNILTQTDLLIDGAYKREFTKNAGEYRGSSNQRLIYNPSLAKNL